MNKVIFNKRFFLVVLTGLLNLSISTFSQTTEYTVKAVSFEKFAFFTEWPAVSGVSDTSLPFIVTVLGDNSFDISFI